MNTTQTMIQNFWIYIFPKNFNNKQNLMTNNNTHTQANLLNIGSVLSDTMAWCQLQLNSYNASTNVWQFNKCRNDTNSIDKLAQPYGMPVCNDL